MLVLIKHKKVYFLFSHPSTLLIKYYQILKNAIKTNILQIFRASFLLEPIHIFKNTQTPLLKVLCYALYLQITQESCQKEQKPIQYANIGPSLFVF